MPQVGDLRAKMSSLLEALDKWLCRPITVMEVCGTHTVSIFRSGIRTMLPEGVRLLSGPGCPVCVTDQAEVDAMVRLAKRPGVVLATYGDMVRVPGSCGSLAEARASGAEVAVVSSAIQALALAGSIQDKEIVFAGIGFETTAPATAVLLREARSKNVKNLSVLSLHKLVPPVLRLLASDPMLNIDGFLLPGHVSTIIGTAPYAFLAEEYGKACAVAGFEPLDIMAGIVEIARQICEGRPAVRRLYGRVVRHEGNVKAQELLEEVFRPASVRWRGIGLVEASGLVLANDYSDFDAYSRFGITLEEVSPPAGCRCGDVLAGRITPPECPLFGRSCTPQFPVGPCMVSSEGSCSAYYRYSSKGVSPWGA
ncbi:MAG TPA: hydrogenase formation protein HypD [Thermosynergistes sp.]|mgnify:FL=1|nr:hydrogenase formation protein HypD [Thermosynergistes sp.]